MEGPSLDNVCPYCFSTIVSTADRFKLWPPWEACEHCGRRFGRDRCGRTVKIGHLYLAIIAIVVAVGVFIYITVR